MFFPSPHYDLRHDRTSKDGMPVSVSLCVCVCLRSYTYGCSHTFTWLYRECGQPGSPVQCEAQNLLNFPSEG